MTQIAKSAMRAARKTASSQDRPCPSTEVRRMEAANSSHPAAAMPQRTGDPRKVGHCSRSWPLSSLAFSVMGSPCGRPHHRTSCSCWRPRARALMSREECLRQSGKSSEESILGRSRMGGADAALAVRPGQAFRVRVRTVAPGTGERSSPFCVVGGVRSVAGGFGEQQRRCLPKSPPSGVGPLGARSGLLRLRSVVGVGWSRPCL